MYDMSALYQAQSVQDAIRLRLEHPEAIVSPGAVLVEHGLLAHELSNSIVAGLGSQQLGVAGRVGDVQVPDLLVVVEVGALDGVGGADAVSLVLVVDGQVCQMGLEAPVGRTVHAGGGESTINAQLSLAGLNVVGDLLQVIEALDVVLSVAGGGQQLLIVNDAVGLDDVSDAGNKSNRRNVNGKTQRIPEP